MFQLDFITFHINAQMNYTMAITVNLYTNIVNELNLDMINGMCFIDDNHIFLDSCTSTGNFDFRFVGIHFTLPNEFLHFCSFFCSAIVVVTVTVVSEYTNLKHTQ